MKNKTAISLLTMAVMLVVVMGCVNDPKPEFGEMTDARDGQTYQTVKLSDQTWLAQDLNYETENSWCYGDDPANCEVYGRLYDWDAAIHACPDGWHLPSDQEWSTLIKYLDPRANPKKLEESQTAGGMLKTAGTLEDGSGLCKRTGRNSSRFQIFLREDTSSGEQISCHVCLRKNSGH